MTAPAGSASAAKFINSQQSDQFLASKFKGTDVLGADNQKIGDVTDILFDKSGKVLAYVVGVGGFLGIGAKDVALEPSAFEVVAGDPAKHESDKLKIAMTKDELKQAANFEAYKAPASTTGMGDGTSPLRSQRPSARPPRNSAHSVASLVELSWLLLKRRGDSPGLRAAGGLGVALRGGSFDPGPPVFPYFSSDPIPPSAALPYRCRHGEVHSRFERRRARRAVAQFRRAAAVSRVPT